MYNDETLYEKMLNFAINQGGRYVLFVIRPEIDFDKNNSAFLNEMHPYLKKDFTSDNWPCTQIFDDKANILIFDFVKDSLEILRKYSDSFASWEQPNLPEDMCILSPEGDAFLATSASEKCVWVDIKYRDQYLTLNKDIKYLSISWKLTKV
ncbi:hypothetical protein [Peredibacter starrii]|uniref:Uncharacterized protein n=1 Tax=Peredibacter starrii TaxID=28202 RepID=A0AAX4HPC6_9BACT|nr:hypothetical protein [Peredibacter starrii]WPU65122.1 hypothetical protein SOO65_20710 [Peredibacter starrii]